MANFRTSARTVDMLGRQQIAGIPTAINELFKNAYDAYASSVVVDWLRDRDFLVIRDDGIGMSFDDFSDRWLTIGTDSKVRGGHLKDLAVPRGARRRPVMGEKGIGRLAIAALGPQVLVFSRPRMSNYDDQPSAKVVAALIPWRLFEVPGITLDDIEIPVLELAWEEAFTHSTVQRLVTELRDSITGIRQSIAFEALEIIESELSFIEDFDISALTRLHGPQLSTPDGHGTFFVVSPTDDSLPLEVDGDRQSSGSKSASPLKKLLTGFSDTMSLHRREAEMLTSFIVRRDSGEVVDLINGDEFFDEQDFANSDHEFVGEFDEYGTFHGTVSIYQQEPLPHVVPWPAGKGAPTQCGPFKIRFGYVHANLRHSSLAPELHGEINKKLDLVAGLYVYRDGVRILPYGSSDVDYLAIEERRSKNAGYYFFSYRRMFGAIALSSRSNPSLHEKAGREGFRENIAYRQLRAILINFVTQLAADFFRTNSQGGREFLAARDELERTESIRRNRERVVGTARHAFRENLQRVLGDFAENQPQQRASKIYDAADKRLSQITGGGSAALNEALAVERSVEDSLRELTEHYTLSKPQGIGLDRETNRDWSSYEREYQTFDVERKQLVSRIRQRVAVVTKKVAPSDIYIEEILHDTREMLDRKLTEWIESAREVEQDVNDLAGTVLEIVRAAVRTASQRAHSLEREMGAAAGHMAQDEFFALRQRILSDLDEELTLQQETLLPIRTYLGRFHSAERGNAWQGEMEAVEEEVLSLRTQVDNDLELTQLGRAIELINHEFASSIKSVRQSLQALRPWGRSNAKLGAIERQLATSFEHLDNYLALFTPLQRRLYRKPTEITGSNIEQFLTDLFGERLSRHEVELVATNNFSHFSFVGYPSTFYPVFVNLVDNAIFWLSDRPNPRIIQLDVRNGALQVSDNGPGILPRDREAIFEHGFSRKPGGRGLGLKISSDVLKRAGWSLEVDAGGGIAWPQSAVSVTGTDSSRRGASFLIVPPNDAE
ncbi:ATP-binding protein [Streptomyces mirabilis]|uniref:ATP-binding protein n=1 Tax=Streptomyces mirabilis TaxID=68239 RepID=UPI0036AC1417